MPREQKPHQIQVSFLMDKTEHKKIKEKADESGMSMTSYFKFVALNTEIIIRTVKTEE